MSIVIITPTQKRVLLEELPDKCICGTSLYVYKHTRMKGKKEGQVIGYTSACGNRKCSHFEGHMIGETHQELLGKVRNLKKPSPDA